MGDDLSKSQPPPPPPFPSMRDYLSKYESPPPPPSPFFSEPWRKINWRNNQSASQYVKEYRPQSGNQQLRILLHGPIGAGKSSFINSVQSVLHGRMYAQALVDNTSHLSFTKKYTTYKIQKGRPGTFYPFVFNDIMGLEPHGGVHVEDIKLALKGHVMDGYTFNPHSKLSVDDRFYKKSPTANDKVHVLVCVIDANKLSIMKEEVLQKIRDIRAEASDLGIPQVVIVTKPDHVCPEIKADVKNVYKVKYLKEKLETFSAQVGIPMNCIFPVKNYHEEIDIDSDVDSLILSALRNIINFGDDNLNFNQSAA
ncbi:interferon-induced protein 44-like [Chaetodon auriga]|uniref:interferon-induced protein 44-like n=1 Tax=Chaetodon auriga TaxID=39042 RepID=UPI0040330D28